MCVLSHACLTLILILDLDLDVLNMTPSGFPRLLESAGFLVKFPGLESPGNDFGPGKCWRFKLKVLESPGICWEWKQ